MLVDFLKKRNLSDVIGDNIVVTRLFPTLCSAQGRGVTTQKTSTTPVGIEADDLKQTGCAGLKQPGAKMHQRYGPNDRIFASVSEVQGGHVTHAQLCMLFNLSGG